MRSDRRAAAVAVSAVAVLAPAGGAATAAWQARALMVSGSVARDGADALLLLACLGCAAVLVWGTTAAAAGVREGWRTAGTDRMGPALGTTLGSATVRGPVTAPGSRAPSGPGHRLGGGHMVVATVAALVVAALSAGPATAATAAAPPVTMATSTAPGTLPSERTPPAPGSEPSVGTHPFPGSEAVRGAAPVPGSWAALADQDTPASTSAETAGSDSGPAASTETTADPPSAASEVQRAVVEPFRAPRAVDPASAGLVTGTPTRPALQADAEVVVHAGDSLWALAAEHLGPGATDDEVARAWPAWWQANRAVIGDDPDRLLPGQRLVVPA